LGRRRLSAVPLDKTTNSITDTQNLTIIPPREGEWWWIFADREPQMGEVNIYHSSPTLRWIIVLE